MSGYAKLTVVNLRAVLKDRGIPATGLTRKQQFIDRLEQDDREKAPTQVDPNAPQQPDEAVAAEAAGSTTKAAEAGPQGPEGAASAAPTDIEPPAEVPKERELPGAAQKQPAETTSAPLEGSSQPSDAPRSALSQTPLPSLEPPPTLPEDVKEPHIPTSSAQASDTEESRKRKRRSVTPPIPAEVVAKKLKQSDEETGAVHLAEDKVVETQVDSMEDIQLQELQENIPAGPTPAEHVEPKASDESKEAQKEPTPQPDTSTKQHVDTAEEELRKVEDFETSTSRQALEESPRMSGKDARYRELFNAPGDPTLAPSVEQDEMEIAPALHPATPAIYIRNLMRPLQLPALKNHLIRLATPPSHGEDVPSESPSDIIVKFHIDPIRTHAFVLFSTSNQAARVRASLHDRVWPTERDRKPLWVDFIPEDKVEQWIEMEIAYETGGGRGAKRWEVTYERSDDGTVHAELQDAGAAPPRRHSDLRDRLPLYGAAPNKLSPLGEPSSSRSAAPPQPEATGKSFVALDALFPSTTAKPKLYYHPVDEELAQKRLDEFDRAESSRWARGLRDSPESLRRYTFEDGDTLVDSGEHRPRFGDRAPGGFPRGGGRGRRGPPHGGYRGR
ncbi:hypothetical protein P152DRAFT_341121 [Eremomyces bilateralis CBS 781.70]|uniref:SAP domain-containing protein n=1 Tax=Eremomyces bilateralis CBS 781.70 TaxID=1392243 RepID=A0A6G1G2Z9_9PEZI|nr:uncharacterized protein P152DRAFT_341121 [Eremomyces bilateralis CBS 781.70]KAF1812487.1 hypothetical protein P152DRAFT_341121 [Eremomyces bilateralis CBS 781.70]